MANALPRYCVKCWTRSQTAREGHMGMFPWGEKCHKCTEIHHFRKKCGLHLWTEQRPILSPLEKGGLRALNISINY